jgi:cytoskeletal protein CcmA (bactofilin family)
MFSKSKTSPDSGSVPSAGGSKMASLATGGRNTPFSILGPDVEIKGNVTASVDIHIDGNIEGDLTCANLVQGEASEIKGAVMAETARLSGLVDGSIEVRDLTIERTARITGDVTYENLTIAPGGQVDGRFTHRRNAGMARAETTLQLVGGEAPA